MYETTDIKVVVFYFSPIHPRKIVAGELLEQRRCIYGCASRSNMELRKNT